MTSIKTYRINGEDESITCLRCGLTSHNRNDVRARYCDNCKEFHYQSRCDFCLAPDVDLPYSYRSQMGVVIVQGNYPRPNTTIDMDDLYSACEACHALIVSNRLTELLERVVGCLIAAFPEENLGPAETRHKYRWILGSVLGVPIP